MPQITRISLDAFPVLRDLNSPIDYSGRILAELTHRRLFCPEAPASGCAADAEECDGGLRWRVRLDEQWRWSDGRPITATDVVTGTLRALAVGAPPTQLLDADDRGPVSAVSSDVVEFRFARPTRFAPALLSAPAFAPFSPRGCPDGQPVVAGDYQVTTWQSNCVVAHRLNGSGPDALRFDHVPDPGESVDRYESGELDATSPTGFGVREVERVSSRPDLFHSPVDLFGSLDFGRYAPRGWLASASLRRTVSAIVDRSVFEHATRGLADGWRWPGAFALGVGTSADMPDGTARDSARAAVDGPLDIAYSDFAPNAEIAEATSHALQRELGVEVRTTCLSFGDYIKASARRRFCLLYSITMPGWTHPSASLSDWRSGGRAAAGSGIADPVLDSRLDTAESAEESEAAALWTRAVDRWCTLLPSIPLVRVNACYLRRAELADLTLSASGLLHFRHREEGEASRACRPD